MFNMFDWLVNRSQLTPWFYFERSITNPFFVLSFIRSDVQSHNGGSVPGSFSSNNRPLALSMEQTNHGFHEQVGSDHQQVRLGGRDGDDDDDINNYVIDNLFLTNAII